MPCRLLRKIQSNLNVIEYSKTAKNGKVSMSIGVNTGYFIYVPKRIYSRGNLRLKTLTNQTKRNQRKYVASITEQSISQSMRHLRLWGYIRGISFLYWKAKANMQKVIGLNMLDISLLSKLNANQGLIANYIVCLANSGLLPIVAIE